MNRYQKITLIVTAANLLLILLFPPFDYAPPGRGQIPAFEGFDFAFSSHPNRVINSAFLYLEVFVVLINATIAWLLMQKRTVAAGVRKFSSQNAVLLTVALNLIVILLFPPFENIQAVTQAVLPSFDAFYFVFGDNHDRTIVTTLLYLEVMFVLVNGALLWLLFKPKRPEEDLSPEEALALAMKLQKKSIGGH